MGADRPKLDVTGISDNVSADQLRKLDKIPRRTVTISGVFGPVELPVEPSVGTTLTAPKAENFWARDGVGWWVVNAAGEHIVSKMAPASRWADVYRSLMSLGGVLTVATEYRVTYRSHGMDPDENDIYLDGFPSTDHIKRWQETMNNAIGIRITKIESQRVTRSEWTTEPLEEFT